MNMEYKMMKLLCLLTIAFVGMSCEKHELQDEIRKQPEHVQGTGDSGKKPDQGHTETQLSDFEKGTRATVKWKVEKEMYFDRLNYEDWVDTPEKLTMDHLKDLVQFHASSADGKIQYDFIEKDLPHVQLKEVTFDESAGEISFNIYFKEIKSKSKATLPYSLRDYFLHRFKVDQAYVSQHGMRGIYEFIGGFTGQVMQGTDGRFVPGEVRSKGKDDHRNSMTFTFMVFDKKKNREILEITRDLHGFRPVDEIVSELKIYPTHALLQSARDAVSSLGKKSEQDVFQMIKRKFLSQKWMLKTEYEYRSILLELTEKAIYGQGDCLDVYLEDPRWLLKSAELKDKDLYLTVQLEAVNSLVLKEHVFHLVVKGVR